MWLTDSGMDSESGGPVAAQAVSASDDADVQASVSGRDSGHGQSTDIAGITLADCRHRRSADAVQ